MATRICGKWILACSVASMAREPKSVDIVAEMVANVMQVVVAAGDRLDIGDTVVLLESMKMEIPVLADRTGVVAAIKVSEGDVVQEGDILITVEL